MPKHTPAKRAANRVRKAAQRRAAGRRAVKVSKVGGRRRG